MPTNVGSLAKPGKSKGFLSRVIFWGFAFLAVLFIVMSGAIFEKNNAPFVKVKQSVEGDLTVKMTPGWFLQNFGTITPYQKSSTLWFSAHPEEGSNRDESINVMYTDGGRAKISGTIRYDLPFKQHNGDSLIILLHQAYKSERNFVDRAIRQLVVEAVQLTAGLMTSEESYTTKKGMFGNYVMDQVTNGVYLVDVVKDTLFHASGETEIIDRSIVRRDAQGNILRKTNPLLHYGVAIQFCVVYDPDYEYAVREQIKRRLSSTMQRAVKEAEAILRTQEAITMKAEGERDVEGSKYAQLTLNAGEQVQALMNRERARIRASSIADSARVIMRANEYLGKAEREKGRGESTTRTLLQEADANLTLVIDAIVSKHEMRANAIAGNGEILPRVILGDGASGGGGMDAMFQIMGMNAARQMVEDMAPASSPK